MLQASGLYYSIGGQNLLNGVDWNLQPKKRVALVGPNGSGKTTLLRILAGRIQPQKGTVIKPRHYSIGYLPQEEVIIGHGSVLENALGGRPEILELEQKIHSIHAALNKKGESHSRVLDELGSLEQQFQSLGGYGLEASGKKILSGLGFKESQFGSPFSELSGGWCMRVYLARLLLREPDLLLLDEPTNHLDIPSMEWLEQYLVQFKGSVVIVSHDRFFIDRIAHEIYELDRGELSRYRGDYHFYEKLKEKRINLLHKKWEEQETEEERLQRFINRYKSDKKRAGQVQSRIRMLEKMERIELPPPTPRLDFHLSVDKPSFKDVLMVEEMSFRYNKEWLLRNISLNIMRGERIALVGANGEGKTTLTRIITGDLLPQQGKAQIGSRVQIGYYAQHQIQALNLNATAYDEVASTAASGLVQRIRAVLGIFQFDDQDIVKKVGVLSGGEKARVALAKILLSPVNFLIMDEPTTHLDIAAREALEDALQHYNGTLLLISHDRYFLDKLVEKTIELKNGHLHEYYGNYSYYLWKRIKERKPRETQSAETKESKPVPGKKSKEQKRKEAEARQAVSRERSRIQKSLAQMEEEIAKVEVEKKEIEVKLGRPETYTKGTDVGELNAAYAAHKKKLEALYGLWEREKIKLEDLAKPSKPGL